MRIFFTSLITLLTKPSNRKTLRFSRSFFVSIILLLSLYSYVFHVIMKIEGRDFSALTGLYWTLTVMTTLGFGDITFTSDLGKFFTIITLISGLVLFIITLPFAFIRFIYTPWLEAQAAAITPKKLPTTAKDHAILVGPDSISLHIADKLKQYKIPYCILCDSQEEALSLHERGYSIVLGDIDDGKSYLAAQVKQAAIVVALKDDLKNTNIVSTVKEVCPEAKVVSIADTATANSVLHLAGSTYVYNFTELLGKSLAGRVFNSAMQSSTIARFEELCIAEAPVLHTNFAGKTVQEADLRGRFGLTIVGIWKGMNYMSVKPDTCIDEGAVLLLAGTADSLEVYDRAVSKITQPEQPPVLILGGGRVGEAVALALDERKVDFRLIDKNPNVARRNDPRFVLGDASDYEVLKKAGIKTTKTIVVTTHNDDLNIYLSIYCRKLYPAVQIISRATLDRNIASLYSAGASLVISHALLMARTIVNLLRPESIFSLTEGINVMRAKTSATLIGKTLIESNIREKTGCNIIAIHTADATQIPPNPNFQFSAGDELILIGTDEETTLFLQLYKAVEH